MFYSNSAAKANHSSTIVSKPFAEIWGMLFCLAGSLLVGVTNTFAHLVRCLLKARPEITFPLISSKTISVGKPEQSSE